MKNLIAIHIQIIINDIKNLYTNRSMKSKTTPALEYSHANCTEYRQRKQLNRMADRYSSTCNAP